MSTEPPATSQPVLHRGLLANLRQLGSRFASVYVGVHIVLLFASSLPVLGDAHHFLAYSIAKRIFAPGVPDGTAPSGSGDRAVDWAAFVLALLIAASLTAAWSLVRPRRSVVDDRFQPLVRLFARLYLSLAMFGYGSVKVLKSQFPAPNPAWLDQTLGDGSPMRLLWAFMGASTTYSVFTGLVECLAAVLLLARKTRLLGALLAVAVMTNVLLLNMSYDVPVKLGSSHLLLLAVFVAWPDRAALLALLVPASNDPWPRGNVRRVSQAVLALLIGGWLWLTFDTAYTNYHLWGDGKPHHALYGRYDVESMRRENDDTPSGGDPARWQRVMLLDEYVVIKSADGRVSARELALDDNTITFGALAEGVAIDADPTDLSFRLVRRGDGKLSLQSSAMELVLAPHPSRLHQRGFHWVTEQPYNR